MTTIVLDYDLMNQVVQIAGHPTPQEAVALYESCDRTHIKYYW